MGAARASAARAWWKPGNISSEGWRNTDWWSSGWSPNGVSPCGWSSHWWHDGWSCDADPCDSWSAQNSSCAQHESKRLSLPTDEDKCVVCLERECIATLVHGETGHSCTCMECARMLKDSSKPCPLCREPIDLVIRTFKS